MKRLIFVAMLLIASAAIWFGCKDKEEEYTGSISGIVTDKATGEPIKNAGVELKPSGKNTVTGSDGQFEFVEIELGEYTLVATKTGYNDGESSKITVSAGQTAHCDIQMEKLPPALKVTDDAGNEISEIDFGEETDVRMKPFSIFNNGTQTLEWEISWTAEWIEEISKTSGTLNAGATQSLNMKIDRSLLQSGMNTTTVSITSNDGSKQLTIKAVNGTIPATLNTLPATEVTTTSAKFNGTITEVGYPSYTERGFVYAESSMPTLENTIHRLTASVSEETQYSAIATGLTLGHTYYVRAYAINAAGTAYSTNQVTVIPAYILPEVSTNDVTNRNMAAGTATFNGTINNIGDPAYTERGFAYGTSHNPTVDDITKVVSGTGTGAFSANVSGLQIGTTYYIRAYARNSGGIAYGSEKSLNFESSAPSVTTQAATNINKNNGTATFNGTITNAGDPAYNEKGFAYGTSRNPNIDDDTKKVVSGTGTGAFSANITDLQVGHTYYIRAYAKNEGSNTAYGEEITLDFSAVAAAVTTSAPTNINIGNGTATFNGNVTNAGDPIYTEKGFVYGPAHNPNVEDNLKKIVAGTGTGAYTANVTNLEMGSVYYVRAYVINAGTAHYGAEQTLDFTAVPAVVTTSAPTNKNIANGTATFNGSITNAGDPAYTEKGFVYATTSNPNIEDNTRKTVAGSGTGAYSVSVNNLVMGETYYIRAYVINAGVTHYGAEQTLDFNAVLPTVTIQAATNVDLENKTATLNGTIISVGDPSYTERGFVYGTMTTPTIYDATIATVAGTVTGTYTKTITGLQDVTYYVRAYAKNSAGDVAYSSTTIHFKIEPAKLCEGCGPGGSNLWVATNDAAGTLTWGPTSTTTNATNQSDGMQNMSTIITLNSSLSSYPAFEACNSMGDGWYLPSKNELDALYQNRDAIGNFSTSWYWSSTEQNENYSWNQNLNTGSTYNGGSPNVDGFAKKNYSYRVRCVKKVE